LWQTEGQLHPLVVVHPGGDDLHIYSLLIPSLAATENTLILQFGSKAAGIFAKSSDKA
jgi:hypothetical protein